MSDLEPCVMCGSSDYFMALVKGMCLACGDRMQGMEKVDIIEGFVKACLRVKKLEEAVQEAKEHLMCAQPSIHDALEQTEMGTNQCVQFIDTHVSVAMEKLQEAQSD